MWSNKFLARGGRKGHKKILLGEKAIPKDGEELVGDDESMKKEKTQLKKLNMDAHNSLILAMPDGETEIGRVVFSLVRGEQQLSRWECNGAWKRLENSFEPKTAPSRMTIKQEPLKLMQKKRQEPEAFSSPKWKTKC